jgi:O-antigen/teichoic acid export membrane protein
MALPMTIGGVILARPLMGFIMNEEFLTGNVMGYYGSDLAFQFLIISTFFAFFTTLFSFTLIASGNQAKLLKINLYGVLFNIITNLLFIPTYGFVAAGITTIFSEILIIVLTYRTAKKYVHFSFDWKTFMKICCASVLMGTFVFLIQDNVPIIPLVGIGAAVFIASLIPLRILTPAVLDIVKKK